MWAWSGIYMNQMNGLNQTALVELAAWFQKYGFDKEDSRLFAEALSSRHRHNLREWGNGPRNAEIRKELGELGKAVEQFKTALEKLSVPVRAKLSAELFRRAPDPPELKGFMVSSQTNVSKVATLFLHPASIRALELIEGSASEVVSGTPKDRGGKRSGPCDVDGTEAKRSLIVELRSILQVLSLPISSSKRGPLSECFELIHWAASGDRSPGLADDYAELAPTTERQIPIF